MSSAAKPTDLNEGDIRRNPGEPDAEQAAASTYNKPRIEWQGLTIAIENPAGSVRRGRNRHGVTWEVRMRFDYGEILGTLGVDGDPVDVILGPNMDAPVVYVVHQRRVNDWESYDEDKCCVGFDSQADAEQAFLSNYNDPRFLGPVTAMPVDEFVAKVRATRDKPAMIKAHISGYTRKDGVAVASHEDKRTKHSPEQMAKWAEEKRQREQSQIAAGAKSREEQKAWGERMSAQVGTSGVGKHFTPEEMESVRTYIRAGDRHGAQAEGRQAAVNAIGRHLKERGFSIEHVSESQVGKSTSLYIKVGDDVVRVSDHELPATAQREHNRSKGLTGKWSREVVVNDWSSTSMDEFVADVTGKEMTKSLPLVLFLKSHVGPYLRGGKIVNVAGYQGRPARARAANGQLSLFAPPSVVMGPNRYKDKHPVHDTRDLFDEPQHTEPTRELIAEHERLVQVLRSPSHEDDEVEAKKQEKELAGYKKDAVEQHNDSKMINNDDMQKDLSPLAQEFTAAYAEDPRGVFLKVRDELRAIASDWSSFSVPAVTFLKEMDADQQEAFVIERVVPALRAAGWPKPHTKPMADAVWSAADAAWSKKAAVPDEPTQRPEKRHAVHADLQALGVTPGVVGLFRKYMAASDVLGDDPYASTPAQKSAKTKAYRAMYAAVEKLGGNPSAIISAMHRIGDFHGPGALMRDAPDPDHPDITKAAAPRVVFVKASRAS